VLVFCSVSTTSHSFIFLFFLASMDETGREAVAGFSVDEQSCTAVIFEDRRGPSIGCCGEAITNTIKRSTAITTIPIAPFITKTATTASNSTILSTNPQGGLVELFSCLLLHLLFSLLHRFFRSS
jgi:hypothetical protein